MRSLELLQPLVLRVDLGDALLELAGGVLDLLERLAAALERLAALAQLASTCAETALFQSSSSLLGVLEDDAQLRHQHAPELLHELRLRQAQRQGQAEVLDVVALDQLQLAREAIEVERLAEREAEAELGIEARERRASISRISPLRAAPTASSARRRSHSATNALRAPRLKNAEPIARLHLGDLVAQAVGRQVDEHVLEHPRVDRAHRLQQRRALLELRRLGLDALEHQADLRAVLAAQAAQLERLLGELAALVADVAADVVLDPLRAFLDDLLEHLRAAAAAAARRAPPRAAAGGSSSAPSSSPPTRAASACARRAERRAAIGTPSVRAVSRCCCAICASTCSSVASGSSSASILLRTTKRVGACAPRWSRQIARSDLVTPVSAPRMKTVACALGSRLSVSSGSAPIAFRPGVSRTTRPCLSSGCG